MKTTLREVARAAGVSAMAVSSVLHGTGKNVRVGEETADRIRKAATELNYAPNNLARNLRSGRTQTVGVVLQHFQRFYEDNPYYPQLINGIMGALFPAEYTLALCPKLVQDGDIGSMLDGRFDGVLWARPDFSEANIATLRKARTPLVMMHAPPGTAEGVPTFCADNEAALHTVMEHIAGLGHEETVFIIDQTTEHTAEGQARCLAYQHAVHRFSLKGSIFAWDEKTASFEEFRLRNREVTAAVCYSDTLAGHLLRTCIATGISVPRDLSVTGFDSSSFCERTQPRLTSLRQPVEQMAYEATRHLLSLIDGLEPSKRQDRFLYECGLDVRDSTCPPSHKRLATTSN